MCGIVAPFLIILYSDDYILLDQFNSGGLLLYFNYITVINVRVNIGVGGH